MKRTLTRALAVAGVVGLGLTAAATPALALDRNDLVRAAQTAITNADIPKSLHDFKDQYSFSAFPTDFKTQGMCGIPTSTDPSTPNKAVVFSVAKTNSSAAGFSSKKGPYGTASTFVYPSAAAAKKAFAELTKNIKTCTGSTTQTSRDDSGAEIGTNTQVLTNGVVTAVTVMGTPAVFVHSDQSSTFPNDEGTPEKNHWDSYSVYALANDAILYVQISPRTNVNLKKTQVNGANDLLQRAVDLWLKS